MTEQHLPALPANNGVQHFNFFDPQQFETMQRVCKMFANSELVPDMYKVSDKNPETKAIANCMIAVSIAMRIGADPLMIMQNMVIIYSRPSWSSKFLISTVNTCGRFKPLQYKFTEKGMLGKVDYTEYEKVWTQGQNGKGFYKTTSKTSTFDGTDVMNVECIAYTTAKGSDNVLESSPVSVRMAVQEGWYTKSGSKWQTMTKQMLTYRAASFWTNAYAPELSMGMKTEDEIRDIIDVSYEEVDPVKQEIKSKANKKKIDFDDEPENDTQETKPEEKTSQEVIMALTFETWEEAAEYLHQEHGVPRYDLIRPNYVDKNLEKLGIKADIKDREVKVKPPNF